MNFKLLFLFYHFMITTLRKIINSDYVDGSLKGNPLSRLHSSLDDDVNDMFNCHMLGGENLDEIKKMWFHGNHQTLK